MLRVVPNQCAAGAKKYFSQADYLSEGQEIVGHWGGKATEMLGLNGEIQKEDFEALCDNLDPRMGQRLTARTDKDRTVGYDFVFDVPKGVSIAYALTQDERILDAFRASVRETMQEVEAETKTRVRTKGRDEERITGNLCWAEFVHFTARPVDGIPDPHLHAHCFAMNTTFDEKENRWKAGQFRDLKRDARYFEAAASARLAKNLNELGYATERRGKNWDLAAIPKSMADKFSRRTQLIEKLAEEKGITNADEKGELGAKTREKKQKEYSMPELRKIWLAMLSDSESALLREVGKGQGPVIVADREADSRSLDHAITHCFERNSVVAEKELLAEALRRGIGHVSVEGVKAQSQQKDIVVGTYRGRRMVTTKEVVGEEKAMLDFARGGRGKTKPLNKGWKIRRDLNKGQMAAAKHILESCDTVLIVKGKAGTGKTELMKEVVEGIEAGGHQLFAFAPSADASRGVLASAGFADATTVAELLVNEKLQEAARGQVVWIDEAGLLGSRMLKQVFDIAAKNDFRVILSGDWKQHSSVERGAAMRLLVQEGGIKPAVVDENMRQVPMDYRSVVDLIADDRLGEGLDRSDQLGWIRELPDAERNAEVARDYADSIENKESVLVVCPTNAEQERITQAIRSELKSRELIDAKDHSVKRLVPLHLTQAEKSDAASYESGDILVFHQNVKGHRNGERITINGSVPKEVLEHAKHFQVFSEIQMAVAQHELVRITKNGKTKDGKHRLNNGSTYKVAEITEKYLRFDNGWLVDRNYGFLTSGYVQTSHSSQGKTVDRVFICEPSRSFGAASREQMYVSASRGKLGMRIYTDDKQALKAAVHRTTDRITATELINGNFDDAELRRLHSARAKIIAAQKNDKQQERSWELIYGR